MAAQAILRIEAQRGGLCRLKNERAAFDFLQIMRKRGLVRTVHFGFGPGGDPAVDLANLPRLLAARAALSKARGETQ